MANLVCNTRNRMCFRRAQQFSLSFGCISVLFTLLCLSSACRANMTLAVHPDYLRVNIGYPVELFCEDSQHNSEDLEFAHGGHSIPSEIANATMRRLYIPQLAKGVHIYYCDNKATNQRCTIRVVVDSVPANVADFECKSKNLDVLNCTWSYSETVLLANFTLTTLVNGNTMDFCSGDKIINKRNYCIANTSTKPRYRQQAPQLFFKLKSCNTFGCNEQLFTIDHFSIVKPDAPSNLKIVKNGMHSHSVLLHWEIPNNIFDFMKDIGIDHKIEYQIAKIDNTSSFHEVDATGLPPISKTYKYQLDLPYAYMQYEVRIYIKSKKAIKDEFWSEFTYHVFYTASEKPQRPPNTVVGAFDQNVFTTTRRIYVYWKQLEVYEEAGANFTYKVVVSHQGSSNPQTILADAKKSLSYVVLEKAPVEAINVEIWSTNDIGSSENKRQLYIPPFRDTVSLRVTTFSKLAYENGTYKLSWIGIDNIDNYTIFWCQHNATKICDGRMNFAVLDSDKTSHVINLPKENRYQFAISANTGMKTSGMIWAACEISKEGISMYGFPLSLSRGKPGKTFVKITWKMDCTLQEGIITGYNISYCPVRKVTNNNNVCNKPSTVIITDPKEKEINITGLKPHRTYQFFVSLNTIYGLKTIENASIDALTTEDTPTSPRNVTITEVESNSVLITWDPPLEENGIIGKYVIYNYLAESGEVKVSVDIDKALDDDNNSQNSRKISFKLESLDAFSNYSLSVTACNTGIGVCSQKSPLNGIFLRTKIGPPSKLKAPTISKAQISWGKPEIPGGTVDFYQILRIKDNEHQPIINTTELFYQVEHCDGAEEVDKYLVRAVNFDEDPHYGVLADGMAVALPLRKENGMKEYLGEWSEPSQLACKSKEGLTMTYILVSVFALAGIVYGSIKFSKNYREMKDIKPSLPEGLGVPEKDSKYTFGVWNGTGKDEKPPSDEMLLLPNSRTTVSTDTKPKEESNCGASDHTDSTVLSETSRGPVERQASEEGSDASLQLEAEAIRVDGSLGPADEDDCSSSDTEVSHNTSPYFSNDDFKKNPTSGYVQQPVVNPATGYVQAAGPGTRLPPPAPPPPAAGSSYVMAAPIFTTGVAPPSLQRNPPASSGYVRPEDAQARSMFDFPNKSPAKIFGPESLPIMPTLPQPPKHGADSSYIQLQSLPSHKQPTQNEVPLKPCASSGYVSPGDAVINKHLSNMLSAGQLAEEAAILDPMMSPDAYCRFSWSTDPANDNLHSFLANSSTFKPAKN